MSRRRKRGELEARLASEGAMVRVADAPKLSPRAAAFWRKLGGNIDSAEVEGVDDGLLSKKDAARLRASGVLVLDEEIAKD